MSAVAATRPSPPRIERADANTPILVAFGKTELAIRGGTVIEVDGIRHAFADVTPVTLIDPVPGADYVIGIDARGVPLAARAEAIPDDAFAGFHFAPGGNAQGRAGGDAIPAINPHSLWDLDVRPSCPDPRGMALVEMKSGRRVWVDIYLLGADHKTQGTSRHGVKIADGDSLDRLDFATASAIVAGHGKRLMTYEEFHTAAFGVTERSSTSRDPDKTGLDAARTSRFGLIQATGNLWTWGTDGDADDPRPSIFGGSWLRGSGSGSRCAHLDYWPGDSSGNFGARAACDPLNPV